MNKNEITPEIADKMQQVLYDNYLLNMSRRKIYNLFWFGILVAIIVTTIVVKF